MMKFYIYQLIIDDSQLTIEDFSSINSDSLNREINSTKDFQGKEEVEGITEVHKEIIQDRFIALYFEKGKKYPYSRKVIDTSTEDLKVKDNPRSSEQIELDKQIFMLIDQQTQKLFMSGRSKEMKKLLTNNLKKEININSILNKEEFLNKLKSIDEISFSVVRNIFNSSTEDTLSNNLVQDIHKFGASEGFLKLNYYHHPADGNILKLIKRLFIKREDFKSITVVGRTDDNLESILNLKEVAQYILIDPEKDQESKMYKNTDVFNLLLKKINQ